MILLDALMPTPRDHSNCGVPWDGAHWSYWGAVSNGGIQSSMEGQPLEAPYTSRAGGTVADTIVYVNKN